MRQQAQPTVLCDPYLPDDYDFVERQKQIDAHRDRVMLDDALYSEEIFQRLVDAQGSADEAREAT